MSPFSRSRDCSTLVCEGGWLSGESSDIGFLCEVCLAWSPSWVRVRVELRLVLAVVTIIDSSVGGRLDTACRVQLVGNAQRSDSEGEFLRVCPGPGGGLEDI